jgi:hypothetical protein
MCNLVLIVGYYSSFTDKTFNTQKPQNATVLMLKIKNFFLGRGQVNSPDPTPSAPGALPYKILAMPIYGSTPSTFSRESPTHPSHFFFQRVVVVK